MSKFCGVMAGFLLACLPAAAQTQQPIGVNCGGANYTDSKRAGLASGHGFQHRNGISECRSHRRYQRFSAQTKFTESVPASWTENRSAPVAPCCTRPCQEFRSPIRMIAGRHEIAERKNLLLRRRARRQHGGCFGRGRRCRLYPRRSRLIFGRCRVRSVHVDNVIQCLLFQRHYILEIKDWHPS